MNRKELTNTILDSWDAVVHYVANGQIEEFTGSQKEQLVLRRLKKEISQINPNIKIQGPETQERFENWYIDLVCEMGSEKIAIEGKFKVLTDGAVPDNRKAAFFDLFKLERYISSGKYSGGIFLWLTNQSQYLRKANGDSIDFSTHQNRIYEPGNPLTARRSRIEMPLPLILTRKYSFEWHEVMSGLGWYNLAFEIS